MEREILFRGRTKQGEWLEGGYHSRFGRSFIIGISKSLRIDGFEVIPETVEQYTGMTDKNGKKIFEGDIVKMTLYVPVYGGSKKPCYSISSIAYKGFAFELVGDGCGLCVYDELEVIGNIHDNPELLKGEANGT